MVQRHLLIKYLNHDIELETGSGSLYRGKIINLDDCGIHFLPEDGKLKPASISWNDVRKIILVRKPNLRQWKKEIRYLKIDLSTESLKTNITNITNIYRALRRLYAEQCLIFNLLLMLTQVD